MLKNQTPRRAARPRRVLRSFIVFAAAILAFALTTTIETVSSEAVSVGGGGTGFLQICKQVPPDEVLTGAGNLSNRIFRFRVGSSLVVEALTGQCTGPIELPSGPAVVEELIDGRTIEPNGTFGAFTGGFRLLDVTVINNPNPSEPSPLIQKDILRRRATVMINEGGVQNPTTIAFTNTYAAKALIEICNRATGADGAAANASQYTTDSLPGSFSVAPGQCSGPILVHIPSTPGAPPATGRARVTQISRQGFTLESASALPADRFNSLTLGAGVRSDLNCANAPDPLPAGCAFNNPRGGFADIDVFEGGAAQQTTVNFSNAVEPARLFKICKIAGPGVAAGTQFTFDITVNGAPDSGATPTVTIPAGDAASGGNCVLLQGPLGEPVFNGFRSFPAGAAVSVTERASAGFLVSAVHSPTGGVPTVNLNDRRATMTVADGFNELTFTNAVSAPISVTTAAGENVSVAPTTNLSLTFGSVTTAGETTVTVIPPGQEPALPAGFALSGSALVYNITTSAAFSGGITVSFDVPNVPDADACGRLRILHYTGGAWDASNNAAPQYNPATRVCRVSQTVTSLSPFAVAQILSPTAAGVSAGGRVTTAGGRGVGGVLVTMTDAAGAVRTARTSAFGYYRFDEVTAGATYVFAVRSKRFRFGQSAQARSVLEETDDINFVADAALPPAN
jgi:hypothetical protein